MIQLENLSKVYRTDEVETTALDCITTDIAAGEFVAIMGPSGCGKSTLLNVIGMLDSPTSGQYLFHGEDITGLGESALAESRKRNIGFVFQSFNLIDELTVAENVELALLYHDVSASERRKRAADVMERIGISARARHMPSLILADEPTGNLDTTNGKEVMQLLEGLNDEGTTIVMVTHSPDHAALAGRTIDLLDGHLVRADAASRDAA